MTSFVSFKNQIEEMILAIVASNELHAKWLNTLSFLENDGARKIAACEHPTLVKEEMLKHAAEEFRHAHHLKRQIEKNFGIENLLTYSTPFILGGISTLHYLTTLNVKTSRYLKSQGLAKNEIREVAYLLVTYAIELRAEELYGIYDKILRTVRSSVTIKSILLEEKEHLDEMLDGLKQIPSGLEYANHICAIEGTLCKKWLDSVAGEMGTQYLSNF